MIYKWKTWVQDIVNDPEVQESLDEDLTEICQKGGWEVWQINIVDWSDSYENPKGVRISDHIIQRIVTLRSLETVGEKLQPGDIPIMQSAMQEMRKLSQDVQDTSPDSADRYSALRIFYSRVGRILGLNQ